LLFVHLADFSLDIELENPTKNCLWHKMAENCVHNGKGYLMDVSDQNDLFRIFNLTYISKEPISAPDIFEIISQQISEKYIKGLCSQCMISGDYVPKPILTPIPEVPTPETTPIEVKEIKLETSVDSLVKVIEKRPVEIPIAPIKKSIWCC
jgi:hypothetical protein